MKRLLFLENTPDRTSRPRSRSILRVVALALLCLGGVALNAADAPAGAAKKSRLTAHRQKAAEAKSLAGRGDFDAAERSLAGMNVSAPDTAYWHFEHAQRLTSLAGSLSRAGKAAPARGAVLRALRSLEQADRTATDVNLKAGIRQQTGFLQERYLGDLESAKTAYRAAAQLLPDSVFARERLRRIEETEAVVQRKKGGR